jgi:polysaccharide biosynthesis/export protein
MRNTWGAVLLTLAVVGASGCRAPGSYINVDDYREALPADTDYIIRPGDVLAVRVFQQENMSAKAKVRADGKISLPFLNDVSAAGLTPVVLSAQIQTALKQYINNPVVTISLEEVRQLSIAVLGEVIRPGTYNLDAGGTVLQAVAAAGGFTNFAYKDVFVLRSQAPGAQPQRIGFEWDKVSRGQGKGAIFLLKHGDVVVVE